MGSETVMLNDWYLPDGDLFDPLFTITQGGNNVEYVGPRVKRQRPTIKSMIPVEPGQNVSTTVQLSSVYNMTKTGNYVIQLKAYVAPKLHTFTRKRSTENTSSTTVDSVTFKSNQATLFVVGRPNALIDESVQFVSQPKAATYNYVGCSSKQKSSIVAAVRSAVTYSDSTVEYLKTIGSDGTTRYTTWFGEFSADNLEKLKSNFDKIDDVVNNKHMIFDCGTCNKKGVFAYVISNQPYKIFLCPVFWQSDVTGTDSMGGTIIHELSHFEVVANTDDNAYGHGDCKKLAETNAAEALNNADNHQFFAENNPELD